jgi:hypothetical protein
MVRNNHTLYHNFITKINAFLTQYFDNQSTENKTTYKNIRFYKPKLVNAGK